MAGHSKWASIKHKKGAKDKKRGVLFTKLAKNISLAAKNGKDPEMNPALRTAIDQAKAGNMPKDNIEKAILKGAGEVPGAVYEEIMFEAYGPGGAALIVECVTDSNNRTVAAVRSALTRNGGSLGSSGSVMYMFEQKGVVRIAKDEMGELTMDELEMLGIENGAEDIQQEEEGVTLMTARGDLNGLVSALEQAAVPVASSGLEYISGTMVELSESDEEKLNKLIEILEELEDVNSVFTNVS